MKMYEQILVVADRFGELTNRKRGRVSDMVLGRGGKLQAISDGAELGFRRYEQAMEWFSANWPEGADWPKDVHRPICDAPPSQAVLSHADGLATSPAPPEGSFEPPSRQEATSPPAPPPVQEPAE